MDAHYLYFKILFEKQDVRLLHELETVKDQLEAELHKMAIRDEPLNEHEQWNYDQKEAYYLFLYRMHTEILIREQRYQLAYDHLHYLSQYEQTEEYALSRMEELDKIVPPEEYPCLYTLHCGFAAHTFKYKLSTINPKQQ
jgi:hypothetical protein